MMTADQLHAAGTALFGAQYRDALREELDVGERILRRWLAGSAPIPDGVRDDVVQLMDARREELLSILLAMENGQ